MKKAAGILGLVLLLAAAGTAQVRTTVTNLTLEKFQKQRLAADREYRENYQRMGFPSPEELEKQREADLAAKVEIGQQLRQARLERERIELESRELDIRSAQLAAEREVNAVEPEFYGGYISNYVLTYPRYWRGRYGHRIGNADGAYRATPVGVYQVGGTRPQRFFSRGVRPHGPIRGPRH